MSFRTRAAEVAWWSMPAACALMLMSPTVSLPQHHVGVRGFQTPPIGPDMKLSQTFTMTTDGLEAIEVAAEAVRRPQGNIRLELYEVWDAGEGSQETLLRASEVPAEDLVRTHPYRFAFLPIADSGGRMYRLDLVASSESGVGLWASKGDRYRQGELLANGTVRWADLVFDARAPVRSHWDLVRTLHRSHPVRVYVIMAGLLLFWLCVRLMMRAIPAVREPDAIDVTTMTDQTRVNA